MKFFLVSEKHFIKLFKEEEKTLLFQATDIKYLFCAVCLLYDSLELL